MECSIEFMQQTNALPLLFLLLRLISATAYAIIEARYDEFQNMKLFAIDIRVELSRNCRTVRDSRLETQETQNRHGKAMLVWRKNAARETQLWNTHTLYRK